MRGFVLSQVVSPRPSVPSAVFANLVEIAGVSTSWWDSADSRDAARSSSEMQAWVAHSNTILDRGRSLSLTLQEHMFVAPPRGGTVKRIGLMRRLAGTSHADCIRYWLDTHAPMHRRKPGLRGFVVSDCTGGGDAAGIDGMVETWWDSVDARATALATPAGRAWNADGRRFLDIPASSGVFVRDLWIIAAPL